MKLKHSVILAAAVAASLGSAVSALAANCTHTIRNSSGFPYTISSANAYVCVAENILQNLGNGSKLIIITADNVTLDLQGNALMNSPARAEQPDDSYNNFAVYSDGRTNLNIKNGRIAGFNYGVMLGQNSMVSNTVVEGLYISDVTRNPIYLEGSWNIIRNNIVLGSNLTTQNGIYAGGGDSAVIDNDIRNFSAHALSLSPSASGKNMIVERNRIIGGSNAKSSSGSAGIYSGGLEAQVINNRINGFYYGIDGQDNTPVKIRDNMITDCVTATNGSGINDIANNN